MISVITVDFYSGVFREIQKDSLEKNADPSIPYELLVHDNSSVNNIGHGRGVEELIKKAKYNIILLLDIDAHVILKDWNRKLLELHDDEWAQGVRLIAGEGGKLKPVRPCVMMFDRDYFLGNNMTFQAQDIQGAKFDVGVLFNFQVLSHGNDVKWFGWSNASYPNTIGNDFLLGDEKFVFHHWYGTRWHNGHGEVVREKIDALTRKEFEGSLNTLVEQYYRKNI